MSVRGLAVSVATAVIAIFPVSCRIATAAEALSDVRVYAQALDVSPSGEKSPGPAVQSPAEPAVTPASPLQTDKGTPVEPAPTTPQPSQPPQPPSGQGTPAAEPAPPAPPAPPPSLPRDVPATYDECVDFKGDKVRGRTDEFVRYAAIAKIDESDRTPVIEYNKYYLKWISPQTRLFMFAHECAHHALAHSLSGVDNPLEYEEEADCWAIKTLYEKGVIIDADLELMQKDLLNLAPDDWRRFPGKTRNIDLKACLGKPYPKRKPQYCCDKYGIRWCDTEAPAILGSPCKCGEVPGKGLIICN